MEKLTLPFLDWTKTRLFCYFTLSNASTILLIKGEPIGGKGLTGPICPSLFLNPFPPIPAKTVPFVNYFTLFNARQLYLSRGAPDSGFYYLARYQICLIVKKIWPG